MSKSRKSIARPKYIAQFVVNTHNHALNLDEDKQSSYITTMCARLVREELRRLGWYTNPRTGELESTPKCSSKTLARVFSEYRQMIIESDIKHHLFDKSVQKLVGDFSDVFIELDNKKLYIKDLLKADMTNRKLHENLIILKQGVDHNSEYGKALNSLKIHFALYYNLNVPQVVVSTNDDMQTKRLEKTHNNKVEVNPLWIKKIINDTFENKQPTIGELGLAIALATGRRLTEIFRTGNFKKIDSSTLLFSGQLKTKNRKLFEELKPYPVHTLVDADTVLKAFKKLRLRLKAETVSFIDRSGVEQTKSVIEGDIFDIPHNGAVSSKYASSLNHHAKVVLGSDMTFKSTRAIWAELSYHEAAKANQTKAAYRAEALGHTGGDLSTQEHYDGFECSDKVETILIHRPEVVIDKEIDGAEVAAFDKALLAYLKDYDRSGWNSRAKAWHSIHDEFISLLENNVTLVEIEQALKGDIEKGKESVIATKFASYARKNIKLDGKAIGAPTANGWAEAAKLNEWYESFCQ